MHGKYVVWGGAVAFLATTALFWGIGLSIQREVHAQAEAEGVPQLSREAAAEAVARDDKFGLPSRLDGAPGRDIERAWKEGTPDNPFPATHDGAAMLFDTYAVSVKGCRSQLPMPEKEARTLPIYVTLQEEDGVGRVAAIHAGTGEPVRTRPYTSCLTGSVRLAVFDAPSGGEQTLNHLLVMPE